MEDFPERRITFVTKPKTAEDNEQTINELAKNFYTKLSATHNLQVSGTNFKDTRMELLLF